MRTAERPHAATLGLDAFEAAWVTNTRRSCGAGEEPGNIGLPPAVARLQWCCIDGFSTKPPARLRSAERPAWHDNRLSKVDRDRIFATPSLILPPGHTMGGFVDGRRRDRYRNGRKGRRVP